MTPLLEQFLSEARDLLQDATRGILALEAQPEDEDALHAIFRSVHTVKGGAGLFDFEPITKVVHAAEDLLDAARSHRLTLDPALVDLLLCTVDRLEGWLAEVERSEALSPAATGIAADLVAALRAPLGPPGKEALPTNGAAVELPWVATLKLEGDGPLHAIEYRPAPGCFFSGDDPLRLVRDVPGLVHLEVVEVEPWGPAEALDPYHCNLWFRLVAAADRGAIEEALSYVADQVVIARIPEAKRGSPTKQTFEHVLEEQIRILRLPMDPADLPTRLTAVGRVLTSAFAYVGRREELPVLEAALAGAVGTGSVEALIALLQRLERDGSGPPAEVPPQGGPQRILKVDQSKIDEMVDRVGELVVAKNGLAWLARRVSQGEESGRLALELKEHHAILHRIVEALQDAVMKVRMLPVSVVFQRFPRLLRDLSRKLDKPMALVVEGGDTEADKNVIDRLGDPLVHLVRNAADHGLESRAERVAAGKKPEGTVTLRAFHDRDQLVVEVEDDGKGIDPVVMRRKAVEKGILDEGRAAALDDREAAALVFAAGFSTADSISDLSGRGVGMDVVRRVIESFGGTIHLESEKGRGTRVSLRLPRTMAITRVLLVEAGGQAFGIPMEQVVEVMRIDVSAIRTIQRARVVSWRDRVLPLIPLRELLALGETGEGEELAVLVVRVAGQEIGVVVDGFDEGVDVMLKPLDGVMSGCSAYLGTAILGDGRVLMALNLRELL